MKRLLRACYRLPIFRLVLALLAPLARRASLAPVVSFLTRAIARLVSYAHNESDVPRADELCSPAALALEWQRLMPRSPGTFPILPAAAGTSAASGEPTRALAEIHLRCPLRGTGDLAACTRLMEFDRSLLRAVGGELIVLESQALTGKDHCRVAIELAVARGADDARS